MKRLIILSFLILTLMISVLPLSADTSLKPESTASAETTAIPEEVTSSPVETESPTRPAPIPRPHPEVLSPGLQNIASHCRMKLGGLAGKTVPITEDDFLRALNRKNINSIKITSLPEASYGELTVAGRAVKYGEEIAGSALSKLEFIPAGSYITSASFSFIEGSSQYELSADIFFLSEANSAPEIKDISVGRYIETYKELSYFGTLPGYDPDGHGLEYIIVSAPSNGAIRLDSASGEYEYIPQSGFKGRDSFEYIIVDEYGAYGRSATVSVSVESMHEDEKYDDMKGSPAYADAITLARNGIITGRKVGDARMFIPSGEITRAEFVGMLMKAAGADIKSDTVRTVFSDDDTIPTALKGAVASAYELGYIKGYEEGGKLLFKPNEAISVSESASIVGRALSIAYEETTVPVFSYVENCPETDALAVNALCSVSLLPLDNGGIDAGEALTREYAAKLLVNVKSFIKLQKAS